MKQFLTSILALSCLFAMAQPNPGGNSGGSLVGGDPIGGPGKELHVWFFLEGPFNGATMNPDLYNDNLLPLQQPYNTAPWNYAGTEQVAAIPFNTVDWVLVELRQAASPELALPATKLPGWPKAYFVNSIGKLTAPDGQTPTIGHPVVTQNLYIVIRHRNHIDVMSAGALLSDGNTYTYSFTGSISSAYGGGAGYKEIAPGTFGLASGDIDADGKVFASDFVDWATGSGSLGVYAAPDVDFDGNVFASDFVQWAGNSGINHPVESSPVPVYISQVPE
jgi:hypothetical protein